MAGAIAPPRRPEFECHNYATRNWVLSTHSAHAACRRCSTARDATCAVFGGSIVEGPEAPSGPEPEELGDENWGPWRPSGRADASSAGTAEEEVASAVPQTQSGNWCHASTSSPLLLPRLIQL